MIESVVPPTVSAVEAWAGGVVEGDLLPSEQAHVARAVPKRQEEFRRGRVCAREALAALGATRSEIGVGASRAPRWPARTVGRITHCEGFCAAAVGWALEFAAIGIDAEPDLPLPEGVLDRTASDRERHWARTASSAIACDRLLFSAKESVYKVWSPLTHAWLGFEDADVDVDLLAGSFVATISPVRTGEHPDVPARLFGHFATRDGNIVTAIALARVGQTHG
jgi:4'-phosphopantetheinyl transferase EntD